MQFALETNTIILGPNGVSGEDYVEAVHTYIFMLIHAEIEQYQKHLQRQLYIFSDPALEERIYMDLWLPFSDLSIFPLDNVATEEEAAIGHISEGNTIYTEIPMRVIGWVKDSTIPWSIAKGEAEYYTITMVYSLLADRFYEWVANLFFSTVGEEFKRIGGQYKDPYSSSDLFADESVIASMHRWLEVKYRSEIISLSYGRTMAEEKFGEEFARIAAELMETLSTYNARLFSVVDKLLIRYGDAVIDEVPLTEEEEGDAPDCSALSDFTEHFFRSFKEAAETLWFECRCEMLRSKEMV